MTYIAQITNQLITAQQYLKALDQKFKEDLHTNMPSVNHNAGVPCFENTLSHDSVELNNVIQTTLAHEKNTQSIRHESNTLYAQIIGFYSGVISQRVRANPELADYVMLDVSTNPAYASMMSPRIKHPCAIEGRVWINGSHHATTEGEILKYKDLKIGERVARIEQPLTMVRNEVGVYHDLELIDQLEHLL